MKVLNGADIAAFIKERQARQVRALIQAYNIRPCLAIIQTNDDPVIDTYVRLKKNYGKDILVELRIHKIEQTDAIKTIEKCNNDPAITGVILQLPLADPSQTDLLINTLAPSKDIDGLNEHSPFGAATAMAVNWLLTGYNIELKGKKIFIVGAGRLVGQPLYKLWSSSSYDVTVLDSKTRDVKAELKQADIIVSATGVAGLLTSDMVPIDAIVVDAGTASESGKTVGDAAPELYARHDVTMTPKIGGVGPLTVAALFDNVIRAASENIKT